MMRMLGSMVYSCGYATALSRTSHTANTPTVSR
jgi:hypothetical protein